MVRDAEVDAAYLQKWIGNVTVETGEGRTLQGPVDDPKGDPTNPLTPTEIRDKARRLAAYGRTATPAEIAHWIADIDRLDERNSMTGFFDE